MENVVQQMGSIEIDNKKEVTETKPRVLIIGDSPDSASIAKDIAKRERLKFNADFKKHLALIITGNTTVEDCDENKVDSFGLRCIQINPLTRHYHFECNKPVDNCRTWGRTYDSKAVLEAVKQRLNTENWISENVMEIALKTKRGNKFSNLDKLINDTIVNCLTEQDARVHKFMCFLLQQHRKAV